MTLCPHSTGVATSPKNLTAAVVVNLVKGMREVAKKARLKNGIKSLVLDQEIIESMIKNINGQMFITVGKRRITKEESRSISETLFKGEDFPIKESRGKRATRRHTLADTTINQETSRGNPKSESTMLREIVVGIAHPPTVEANLLIPPTF